MKALLLSLLVLQTAHTMAAVSFAPAQNYPNIGFLFPNLTNAKADPIPMPMAQTYVFTDDNTMRREDRFEPFELWYANQCCARWNDAQGNRLVVGRMTSRLPLFDEEYVSRKRFADELADDANRIDPDKEADINEWVATFVNATVYKPQKRKVNAFNLDEVRAYPCDATNLLVYALRPRRIGNAKNFDWFCVTLQVSDATDPKALRETFESTFIGQIALPNRASLDEGAHSEKVSTASRDEKPAGLSDDPVCIDARKSIENYDAWWFAETDGYIILSDINTDVGKTVIKEMQTSLPRLRAAYEKLVPPFTQERDVSLIRLFQKRDDYVKYVGKDMAWTGGVWMPGRRELVLVLGESTAELLRVIQHEAFHQYLSYAYCMIPTAPWMNEGHACLFENATVSKKGKVTLSEDANAYALLTANLDQAVLLLPRLFEADYGAFYAGNSLERRLKYAMAWGLAYYLQKGAPQERNTPFKNILSDYAASLAQSHNFLEATHKAFAEIDMSVFQDNFREFWLKRRASAMQFDPLEE